MAGGDEDHVGAFRQGIGGQPVGIDALGGEAAARLHQHIAQRVIAGVFRHRVPPGAKQKLHREPERVLRAQRDQNLLWPGRDPASGQGVARDELDQQRVVLVVVIGGERGEFLLPQRPQRAEPPVGVIEERRVGLPVDEGIAVSLPVARLARRVPAGKAVRQCARPVDTVGALGRGGIGGGHGRGVRHEIARPPARGDVVIGQKLGIGERHGDPADPQMLGQPARRGQLFPPVEAARQDALRDHLLDARLQRALGIGGEEEGIDGNGHGATLHWP